MRTSVIVSAYKCSQFLQRRLDNLLFQIEQPEIVIAYQYGSTEEKIINQFEALNQGVLNYKLVHIGTKDIVTLYEAWNLAIDFSHGKYLTNANSDDLLLPGGLLLLANELDKDESIDLVYGRVLTLANGKLTLPKDLECTIREKCIVGIQPMWRRSVHYKFGHFDNSYSIFGDWAFWTKLEQGGSKFMKIDAIIGIYTFRPESLGHSNPEASEIEQQRIEASYG